MIVFDIETGPLPDEQLRKVFTEPELPPHPGEFDKSTVSLGNAKKPETVERKIQEAKEAHAISLHDYPQQCERIVAEAWEAFKERAALSARTGQVLAIGYKSTDRDNLILSAAPEISEHGMLNHFWKVYTNARRDRRKLVGHNVSGFDVPFIVHRSWILGIDVPHTVLSRDRYLDETFVDTMRRWQVANYRAPFVSLDDVASCLGDCGQKLDGVTGADFHQLLHDDRDKALEYLRMDLEVTCAVAKRMGII